MLVLFYPLFSVFFFSFVRNTYEMYVFLFTINFNNNTQYQI